MLLEYLYTLEPPKFPDVDNQARSKAEHAFVLGDKYGLTGLRDLGRDRIKIAVQGDVMNWHSKPDVEKQQIFDAIERYWNWQQEGSTQIRECCLIALSNLDNILLEDAAFKTLVHKNGNFALDLINYIFRMKNAFLNSTHNGVYKRGRLY